MISVSERSLFLAQVDKQYRQLSKKHEEEPGTCKAREKTRMKRVAIATALKKMGYYVTRRRRIIPPIFKKIFKKIT